MSAPLAELDLPQLILALVAVVTAFTTYRLTKRSSIKENEIQAAANQLSRRVQAFDEVKEYADRIEREADRLRETVDWERAENDRLRKMHTQQIVERGQQCSAIHSSLTETVRTLRDVVTDEIAHASADAVLEEAQTHAQVHLKDIDEEGVFGP